MVVHIDAAVDIAPFRKVAPDGVHFVQRRRKVAWATWSLTHTLVSLLEESLRVSEADYFMYLAGTDFPIRRRKELLDLLARSSPRNFLNHYPLVPGIWGYSLIERFRLNDLKSWFVDLRRQHDPNLPRWRRAGLKAALAAERWLDQHFRPRNTQFMPLYHGSSRWCLNRDTVRFVTEYYRSSKSRALRRFLKRCGNSDEIFFQTAILNSPMKIDCIAFDEQECTEIFDGKRPPLEDEKRVYLHYIDWSPAREDPAILVESDLQALRDSGKYFACKFVDDRSLPLMDIIERDMAHVSIGAR